MLLPVGVYIAAILANTAWIVLRRYVPPTEEPGSGDHGP